MEINKILIISGCAVVVVGLALPIAAQTQIGQAPQPSGEAPGRPGACLAQPLANAFGKLYQCNGCKTFRVIGQKWFLRCVFKNVDARPLTDSISRERPSFPCQSRYGFATEERSVVEVLPGNRGNVTIECTGDIQQGQPPRPEYLGSPGT